MSEEVWREIPGWEGYYEVSSHGNYRSLKRRIGVNCKHKENHQGYLQATLYNRTTKKHFATGAHRLVAIAFIDNPKKMRCVHHIDHNKKNNHYSNLEWVTHSQNIKYNYSTGGQVGKTNMKGKSGVLSVNSKAVSIFKLNGDFIETIVGISEAGRKYKANPPQIVRVCRGKLKKHRNLIWRYA